MLGFCAELRNVATCVMSSLLMDVTEPSVKTIGIRLLKHCNTVNAVFADTLRLVSWLFWQFKYANAVLADKLRLVNWLLSQDNSVNAVFADTSRLVSWLLLHHKLVNAMFDDTSRLVSWLK